MSYCVNCGVELDKSAKKCALCSTRVVNPNEPQKKENTEPTPFSEKPFVPAEIKRRFVAYVITMVMLIPNIACTFINAIFYKDGFWSFYVSTTSFLLWVMFVFPFYTKKLRPYLMWFVDTLGVCAYVFFFFVMGYEGKEKWYFSTALPIILIVSSLTLIYMLWVKSKKRHWVLKLLLITVDVSVFSFVCGLILEFGSNVRYAFDIGVIVSVCCATLAGFFAYCYNSRHMRAWLSKRFFV